MAYTAFLITRFVLNTLAYLEVFITDSQPQWCPAQYIAEVHIKVGVLVQNPLYCRNVAELCSVDEIFFQGR